MHRTIVILFRSVLAYSALAAGLACLWWLAQQLERVEAIQIGWKAVATTATGTSAPLVVVDAGHGGHDNGASSNDVVEKQLALDLARRLQQHLTVAGVRVRMTRSDDTFVALEDRAETANREKASAFVSLHLNTSGSASNEARGIETYFCSNKALPAVRLLQASIGASTAAGLRDHRGEKLAELIQQRVCKATGAMDRGIKERGYTVVFRTACPSVLVECGFMTNAEEAARLKREDYREKLVDGIAQGVRVFLEAQELHPNRGLIFNGSPVEPPSEMLTGL